MNKKIIHSFPVKKIEEVEEESTRNKKNKETGETEKITTTKLVKKELEYEVILYEPSRRQAEEVDMEFSIEMSKCIKKGILTKAMLAKKYSDTGGLLSDEDSSNLIRLYRELAETQNTLAKLASKKEKSKNELEKESSLTEKFAEIRRDIVNLETTYQVVFNHTADTKAQNKTILWYLINLSFYKNQDGDILPMFPGDTQEEKEDSYYQAEELEDGSIYSLAKEKLMTFVSFWYFSQNATEDDFKQLEEEVDSEI